MIKNPLLFFLIINCSSLVSMNEKDLKGYYKERNNPDNQKKSKQQLNARAETTLGKTDNDEYCEIIELPSDWDIKRFNMTGSFEKEKE
jgi:hypothetical protein